MINVSVGKSYHIDNNFFAMVNDNALMENKQGNHYRPHFFFFKDPKTPGIFWAIPQSSQVQKYQRILQQKIAKYGKCDTIIIGQFGGRDNAFLIQNMFPIIEKYVIHEHTIGGASVTIHQGLAQTLIATATKVLLLHKKGYKMIFPDVDKIYTLMQQELNATK